MESHMGKACMKKAKVCFYKNSYLIANSLAFVNDIIYAANYLVIRLKSTSCSLFFLGMDYG